MCMYGCAVLCLCVCPWLRWSIVICSAGILETAFVTSGCYLFSIYVHKDKNAVLID